MPILERRESQRAPMVGATVSVTTSSAGAPETMDPIRKSAKRTEGQGPCRITTANGAEIFIREWGEGRPIVFVHGWAVNCDLWQYQMLALAPFARCVAYDKRGHGRSSDPGRGYDYDTLADDLAAVLETRDLKDAVLVGHSMGPAEIVRYLSRHGATRVSRLVLISPALPFMLKTPDNPNGIDAAVFETRRQQWSKDMPKFLADNARAFVTPETSAETVAWIAAMGAQASLKALVDLNHAITETDQRIDMGRITLPTLLIHGAQDRSAPLDLTSRRLATLIPGSELQVYDGAPHGLPITHATRLNADLEAWSRRA